MAREFDKDASYSGQKEIVDAIKGLGVIATPVDNTLSKAGQAADAKATGDAIGEVDDKIGAVAEDGNYIKASETKDVCENLGILDTRAKTNADAVSTLNTLIADDGTTKTLFGLVVSIDADTGVVSLSEPVVESSEP